VEEQRVAARHQRGEGCELQTKLECADRTVGSAPLLLLTHAELREAFVCRSQLGAYAPVVVRTFVTGGVTGIYSWFAQIRLSEISYACPELEP